jgi:hypothetical protein
VLHEQATRTANANIGYRRAYRNPNTYRKLEWFVTIQYHTLVSVSLALVVVGVVKLEEGTITDGTKAVLKVGMALVILSWLLLNFWTLVSWKSRKVVRTSPGYNDGTKASLLSCFVRTLANEICSC